MAARENARADINATVMDLLPAVFSAAAIVMHNNHCHVSYTNIFTLKEFVFSEQLH